MPVRDLFPSEYFAGNPLDGATPHEAYKRLQWGNNPRNTYKIEAPEPMAVLGELAQIIFEDGTKEKFRAGVFFLAVGSRSNGVYFVPRVKGRPKDFPANFHQRAMPVGKMKRVDYYSSKGGEDAYYYHDHEKPYPMLVKLGRHGFILPARHRGGRSYAVNDEGIIG